jgi:hypothetical protein
MYKFYLLVAIQTVLISNHYVRSCCCRDEISNVDLLENIYDDFNQVDYESDTFFGASGEVFHNDIFHCETCYI